MQNVESVVVLGGIGSLKVISNITIQHTHTHITQFLDWMPFLSPNQQHQSTEGNW